MTSQKMVLTRGLPASGKTTWATLWAQRDSDNRRLVSRDDIRPSVGAAPGSVGTTEEENLVTSLQRHLLRSYLRAGRDVVVADTNLRRRSAKSLVEFALTIRPDLTVEVQDFHADLDDLIVRDASRPNAVGEGTLRTMWARFPRKNWWDLEQLLIDAESSPAVQPYVQDTNLSEAVLVDIDGTVAHMDGRGPYEYDKVLTDQPDLAVIDAVRAVADHGFKILVLSGRDGSCYQNTLTWLRMHHVPFDELHMRTAGDKRPDWAVKDEILRQHVQPHYWVRFAYDDRDQVVNHYRDNLGLKVFQVAPGDF